MEYFYALTENQNDIISMCEDQLKLKEQQVFIDHENTAYSKEWKELMETLKEFDKLYVPSFTMFSPDEIELKVRLEKLKEIRAQLYLMDEKHDIDIDVLLDILDYVETSKKARLAVKQREGIQKALEKKHLGEGSYGRPRLNLPNDFEETQKKILRKEMNHETYRTKIGMKRSTYYKYVKKIRDRWKEEELEKGSNEED